MMKSGQTGDYYRARIEAVEDYIFYSEQPDWRIMATILGLPIPTKKEIEVAPIFGGETK